MPPNRQTHTVDPVYAPPVLRSDSPTDTISSEFGEDETTQAEKYMSDEQFAQHVEEELGLRRTNWTDAPRLKEVLLPKPTNKQEENELFEKVMRNLRAEVRKLEEEEIFISVAQKNAGPSFAKDPSARDIDTILQKMIISDSSPASQYTSEHAHLEFVDPQLHINGQYGNAINSSLQGHDR